MIGEEWREECTANRRQAAHSKKNTTQDPHATTACGAPNTKGKKTRDPRLHEQMRKDGGTTSKCKRSPSAALIVVEIEEVTVEFCSAAIESSFMQQNRASVKSGVRSSRGRGIRETRV